MLHVVNPQIQKQQTNLVHQIPQEVSFVLLIFIVLQHLFVLLVQLEKLDQLIFKIPLK